MGPWIIAPANHLSQRSDFMNLRRYDLARNDHLKTLGLLGVHDDADGFGGRHALVCVAVVSDPDPLLVRNTKIHAHNRAGPTPLQLSEPLVRDIETSHH